MSILESFLDEESVNGTPKRVVYIAIRRDGQRDGVGNGSIENPFEGSTTTCLDVCVITYHSA
jgi:hypothetical protein